MLPIVKKDVVDILKEAIIALKNNQHHILSELSNHVIHDASIYQDSDSLTIAVFVYALSKVVQRCCEKNIDYTTILPKLSSLLNSLQQHNYKKYNRELQGLMRYIEKIDDQLKLYIEEVMDKAKIKKASKLHEHGLSIGRTAEILGISQWDLLNYVGKTSVTPVKEITEINERLNYARDLFL
ncbi:hypothetical protein HY837_00520 [archaeon]|nr:hypothetical protein [archaeon]